MNRHLRGRDSCSTNNSPEPKRRKVRKGTQSCWECRRRKVRCIFTAVESPICDGCRRRKTSCISQEFPDEPVNRDSDQPTDDRLSRLESIVEQIIRRLGPNDEPGRLVGPALQKALSSQEKTQSPSVNIFGQDSNDIFPFEVAPREPIIDDWPSYETLKRTQTNGVEVRLDDQAKFSLVNASVPLSFTSGEIGGYERLSRMLLRAWPSQHDLEMILQVPGDICILYHGTMCTSFSDLIAQSTPSVRNILQLPPPGSHPTLIARKLLMLATYLQGLSPESIRKLYSSRTNHHDIMTFAVETAHICVTRDSKLLESVEGIECAMIESMYQNNTGDLRGSWEATRRAMLVAQMMGLHLNDSLPTSRLLENETVARVSPSYMWFRLVQADRYLSMMLGLPQGSDSNSFVKRHMPESCAPAERMQRLTCAAAGWILQRDEAELYDSVTTSKINSLLRKSSGSVPSQWWQVPALPSSTARGMELLDIIVRTMDQFSYFYLVMQLHLPFLLRPSRDGRYDDSKIATIKASRELLDRFVPFRGAHVVKSFCRGLLFLVFVASTAICVAHINTHCQSQSQEHGDGAVLDCLTQERRSDRSKIELSIDGMEREVREKKDTIAAGCADILSRLLLMEADAAINGNYNVSYSKDIKRRQFGCGGTVSSCGTMLQIDIPCLGTIKIERCDSPHPGTIAVQTLPEGQAVASESEGLFLESVDPSSSLQISKVHGSDSFHQPIDTIDTSHDNQLELSFPIEQLRMNSTAFSQLPPEEHDPKTDASHSLEKDLSQNLEPELPNDWVNDSLNMDFLDNFPDFEADFDEQV